MQAMPPDLHTPHGHTAPATASAHARQTDIQARFWDRMAHRYAAAAIADPAGYETTLGRVRSLLHPGDEVLEVGCGTGTTALRLASGVRRWLGTDVSGAMVAIARRKLIQAPVAGLQFEQAEAGAAGPPVDVVLAFNLLHLVADLDGTLARLRQRLRPGGLLISKTPCVAEMNPLLPRLALPVARAFGLAPPVRCFRADALVAAICASGCTVEAVERHGSRGRDFRVVIVARNPVAALPGGGGALRPPD